MKRVTARGDITVFRGTFKFDNFYFNYHIEDIQVNVSLFSRFEHRTPSVHRSVPPNVHLGTVQTLYHFATAVVVHTIMVKFPHMFQIHVA